MGFLKRDVSYEVQVHDRGHWVIDSLQRTKKSALQVAYDLVAGNQHDVVRVLMEEGDAEPQVIFEQICAGRPSKPLTIMTVASAPLCQTIADLYQFQARKIAGQLFRQYLDREGLTVFEIFHDPWRLKALAIEERFLTQGIHRIAGLQSRQHAVDQNKQVAFLFDALDDAITLVRDLVSEKALEKGKNVLENKGLKALNQHLAKKYSTETQPMAEAIIISSYLQEFGSWGTKLKAVIGLADGASDDGQVLIDEIIAEIMDGADPAQEILGPQSDLASALISLIKLVNGDMKLTSKRMQGTPLAALNDVMDPQRFPRTTDVLYRRIASGLGGIKPLTKETEVEDLAAFKKILEGLVDPAGFSGGGVIAEAATKRARIVFGTIDSDLKPNEAIATCERFFKSKAGKLGYLLSLSKTSYGATHAAIVLKRIFLLVQGLDSLRDIMPAKASKAECRDCAVLLAERVEASILPADIGGAIRSKLDKLLGFSTTRDKTKNQGFSSNGSISPDPLADQDFPENLPVTEVEKGFNRRNIRKGHYIFKQGDHGDEAYFVAAGTVEIIRSRSKNIEVLGQVERGEIFGEMALIDNQPRMASARAASNCVLTVIPLEKFHERMEHVTQVDRMVPRLLELFTQRLRVQGLSSGMTTNDPGID